MNTKSETITSFKGVLLKLNNALHKGDDQSGKTDIESVLENLPTFLKELNDIGEIENISSIDPTGCMLLFDNGVRKLQELIELQSASKSALLQLLTALKDQQNAFEKRLILALANGTFFLCLEDVFKAEEESFTDTNPKLFNRENYVPVNVNNNCYERTKIYALDEGWEESSKSSRTPNESKSDGAVDIFGNLSELAESAHLVPQSSQCSTMWFPIVSWVLNIDEATSVNWWTVVQKCIHGAKKVKSNHTETVSTAKTENYTGIKRFQTNRIRLIGQKQYYDSKPCVVIIPILTEDEVKTWKGTAYSAIVLAGHFGNSQAATVYESIGAGKGDGKREVKYILLAQEDEIVKAATLLAKAIKCIAKSCQNKEFANFVTKIGVPTKETLEAVAAYAQIQTMEKIKVPAMKKLVVGDETKVNVRKVVFSAYQETSASITTHPAPDPALLLSKAVSNWLKRLVDDHGVSSRLLLLPGCDSDELCKGSDWYCTYEEECLLRGWPVEKKPRMITVPNNRVKELDNLEADDSISDSVSELDDE